MRILLFGGTTEGRELTQKLAAQGHELTVCVATGLGEEELKGLSCTVHVGRMETEEMETLMPGFDLVIDATHPYAVLVTRNIRTACARTGVPLRRICRASYSQECETLDREDPAEEKATLIRFSSHEQAAEYLKSHTGNILLTIGSKELSAYVGLDPQRLYARVLPTAEALEACEQLGIAHRRILALQGPFSVRMNEAMLCEYGIRYLVTKDGGKTGGFEEKAEAARRCGVSLLVIERPAYEDEGVTVDELLSEMDRSGMWVLSVDETIREDE